MLSANVTVLRVLETFQWIRDVLCEGIGMEAARWLNVLFMWFKCSDLCLLEMCREG